jgi:hypothetical protein
MAAYHFAMKHLRCVNGMLSAAAAEATEEH